jgi:hypothetical protein
MKPETAAQLAEAYTSCAASSTASSTSTTSRPTCCRPPTPTWPGSLAASACLHGARPASCSTACARSASWWPPSSTPCCTTGEPAASGNGMAAAVAAPARSRSTARPCSRCCRRAGRAAAPLGHTPARARRCATRAGCAWAAWCRSAAQALSDGRARGRRPALRRLGRAAAAPRELPGAAGRAARGAEPAAAPAGPGALADAVPDAPPGRDRRAGRRALLHGASTAGLQSRPGGAPRRLGALRRGRRGALLDTLRRAHHAEVFRTLVRDVEGESRSKQVADDLSALADATLDCRCAGPGSGCASATATTPLRRHRLRQARRQGAGLRQRPRRRLPLRRRRRTRQGPPRRSTAPSCAS